MGITVVASESLGATNSYAIGKMDAGVAQAAFSRIDHPDIEALVVPGGNFPTMDWIAAWERQFGKPVITTNQATLWAVLRAMHINTPLAGKGRLLEQTCRRASRGQAAPARLTERGPEPAAPDTRTRAVCGKTRRSSGDKAA